MDKDLEIIIYTSGSDVRFRSKKSKLLNAFMGRNILDHTVESTKKAFPNKNLTIIGNRQDIALYAKQNKMQYIECQEDSLDWLYVYLKLHINSNSDFIFIPGDVPLIKSDSLKTIITRFRNCKNCTLGLMTCDMENSVGYTVIVRKNNGLYVKKIVSQHEKTSDERNINEIWMGIFCANIKRFYRKVEMIKNKKKFEWTVDILQEIINCDTTTIVYKLDKPEEASGIATRFHQTEIGLIMRKNIIEDIQSKGVYIVEPKSTYIESGVLVGIDTIIHPRTVLRGTTNIGSNCIIEEDCTIENSRIPDGTRISRGTQIRNSIPSCFICYSSIDKKFARMIADVISKVGYGVWIDEGEIRIGDSFFDSIGEALKTIKFLIVILSKNSIQSEWVKKELHIALSRQLKERRVIVLPVLVELCEIPIFLQDIKYADFTNEDTFQKDAQTLISDLTKHLEDLLK